MLVNSYQHWLISSLVPTFPLLRSIPGKPASRFPDIIHDPACVRSLRKFAEAEFCEENLMFLIEVERFEVIQNRQLEFAKHIHQKFISRNAPKQVNIGAAERQFVEEIFDMERRGENSIAPNTVFAAAKTEIYKIFQRDVYPRFTKSKIFAAFVKDAQKQLKSGSGTSPRERLGGVDVSTCTQSYYVPRRA